MAFVKGIWRILVAVKDGLVLLLLVLFFGLLYMALSASPGESGAPSSGALVLDLDGVIVEQPQAVAPSSLLTGTDDVLQEFRLRDIVTALQAAKSDSKVKVVVLDLDGFLGGGQVALSRIGAALDGVRAAGKPVLAYATAYGDDGYMLASHASEVWLNPIGGVALTGPGGNQLYYKGLIDKLGITTHVYRVGTYKSFVEPYIRPDQSPEAREASQALADSLWESWRANVAKARPKAQVDAFTRDPVAAVRAAGGSLASAALKLGLVDKLAERQAFGERVAAIAGEGGDGKPGSYAALDLKRYARAHTPSNSGQIGVLVVAGNIVDGTSGPGTAAGDSIADLLYAALAEQDLKALVVRVDSPGGSVLAAEKIRGAILEAKSEGLPVVVSMGDVAASGGYWIATPATTVFAEPATITGSIGVLAVLPSFEGALAKIGVTSDGVRTTPLSGQPDLAGGISPEFDTMAQLGVEDAYRRFIGLVAQARRMPAERVDTIAQGRVWDGGTARQIGLVDRFGGLEDAVAEAARLAKIDPAKAKPYYIEEQPDRFSQFVEDLMSDNSGQEAAIPRDWMGRQAWLRQHWALQALSDGQSMLTGSSIRATCLECRGYGAPAAVTPAVRVPLLLRLAKGLGL